MRKIKTIIPGLLLAACLVLGGCGKDDASGQSIDVSTKEHSVNIITPEGNNDGGENGGEENGGENGGGETDPNGDNPTPIVTPDLSSIDTTTIVGEYNPGRDKTGLPVIDQSTLGDSSTIDYLIGVTEKGAVVEIINGTTYVEGVLMVNKTYRLPSYYVPTNTHANVVGEQNVNEGITAQAWEAWENIESAARADGCNIWIASGYRSFDFQKEVFANYASWDGVEAADTYSARAGHSEHQTGLCFDLNSISDEFADTAAGKWVNDNCWKYGFCIRFPKGKESYSGYNYESWHLRYVGEELAEKLYNNGDWLSMEEFFGLTSTYNYDYE